MKYAALTMQRHALAAFDERQRTVHAAQLALIPITAQELPYVSATMATAFSKSGDGSEATLVAVASLTPGKNLYVHPNGRWLGGYVPANVRAHPFALVDHPSGTGMALCVDESSPCFIARDEEGLYQRLLMDDGQLCEQTRAAAEFLGALKRSSEKTAGLIAELEQHALLSPLKIEVDSGGSKKPVAGLLHVDERKLKQLPDESIAALCRSGALGMAYQQLSSEYRLAQLSKLYRLRDQAERRHAPLDAVDLDSLFGEEDDNLSF